MSLTMNRVGSAKSAIVRTRAVAISGMLASCAMAQITQSKPNPHEVVVHVSDKGRACDSGDALRSFREPIGNSINNGVSAEILVNRSLEDGTADAGLLEVGALKNGEQVFVSLPPAGARGSVAARMKRS